jgi:RNA polymerase sigma factor (sigma-70 family)
MKAKTAPDELRQREEFFAAVTRHLPAIYEWAQHQIASREAAGDLVQNELSVEDVVDALLLRAYREFVRNRPAEDMHDWLVALARKQLAADVKRLKSWRERTVHTEVEVPETPPAEEASTLGDEILDFYEPDEDLKLEDVIPDLSVPTPDQKLESRELARCVDRALEEMPHEWRRALLLRHVGGLTGATLARALRRSDDEARDMVEHAKALLRQHLEEAGCAFKPGGPPQAS